jgi:peptidoglycan/xylan/chitin deacetylase (PgdA/CDA1 family)
MMQLKRRLEPFLDVIANALASAAGALLRASSRRVGVVLAYHAIGDTQGDRRTELVPPVAVSTFRRELRHLKRNYALVPAADLLAAARSRRRWARFPVAITFDDDLPDHATHALGALAKEDVQATFFICGASLSEPHSFWWERLQRVANTRGRVPAGIVPGDENTESDVRVAAAAIVRLPPEARDRISARLLAVAGDDPAGAGIRAEAVRTLSKAGHAIGFHTRRHDPLTRLSEHELAAALTDGRDEVEQAAGQRVRILSYPHGDADERVLRAARLAGYELGFTLDPRGTSAKADPLAIGRINADRLSYAALVLRIPAALITHRRERAHPSDPHQEAEDWRA